MSKSAGEHQWRQIKVNITPTPQGAQVSLFTRRWRGTGLEHEHRIGYLRIARGTIGSVDSVAAILRAAGDGLHAAADRLDDRT